MAPKRAAPIAASEAAFALELRDPFETLSLLRGALPLPPRNASSGSANGAGPMPAAPQPAQPIARRTTEEGYLLPASPSPPKKTPRTRAPVQFSLDPGPPSAVGTPAYYKSWAYRKRQREKKQQQAQEGQEEEEKPSLVLTFGKGKVRRASEVDERAEKKKSLVLVFGKGRGNVRPASRKRKVDERTRKFNRRV